MRGANGDSETLASMKRFFQRDFIDLLIGIVVDIFILFFKLFFELQLMSKIILY